VFFLELLDLGLKPFRLALTLYTFQRQQHLPLGRLTPLPLENGLLQMFLLKMGLMEQPEQPEFQLARFSSVQQPYLQHQQHHRQRHPAGMTQQPLFLLDQIPCGQQPVNEHLAARPTHGVHLFKFRRLHLWQQVSL
jgi:hypothetical protein